MKHTKLFLFALVLFSFFVFGQEEKHFFKQEYFPNSEYLMETKMQIEGKMSFNGPLAKKMPKDAPREIEMNMDSMNAMHFIMGNAQNGTIPFEYSFSSAKSLVKMNGKEISYDIPNNVIKVRGQIKDGNKLEIKDVEGKGVDESMKKMMTEMSSQVQNYIDFPKDGLAIGESFTQTIPYNTNIPGMGNMGMKMEITYTLKEIRNNNIGVFGVDAQMNINMNVKKINIIMLGGGSGEMLFNKDTNQFSYFDLDLDVDMKMDMAGQGNILNKSKAKTITTMKKTK